MTTDTVLTEVQRLDLIKATNNAGIGLLANTVDYLDHLARAIEQAVLQSPEVQRLREDSVKYQILRMAVPKIVADRVREALDEAARRCVESPMMNTDVYCGGTARLCADRIRALIPK